MKNASFSPTGWKSRSSNGFPRCHCRPGRLAGGVQPKYCRNSYSGSSQWQRLQRICATFSGRRMLLIVSTFVSHRSYYTKLVSKELNTACRASFSYSNQPFSRTRPSSKRYVKIAEFASVGCGFFFLACVGVHSSLRVAPRQPSSNHKSATFPRA